MTHSLSGYDAAHQPAAWPSGIVRRAACWNCAGRIATRSCRAWSPTMSLPSPPATCCHAALLDSTGHILADLHVHAFPDALVVETDPACLPTLHETLDKFLIMEDVTLTDVSDQWAIFSVLGDGAAPLTDLARREAPASVPLAPGFDLWLPAAEASAAGEALTAAGAVPLDRRRRRSPARRGRHPRLGPRAFPVRPAARSRMEDAVSYTKGCYVGQEIVARLHARGHTNRALRQILLAEDAPVPPVGRDCPCPRRRPRAGPRDRAHHQRRRLAQASAASPRPSLCPQGVFGGRDAGFRADRAARRADVRVRGSGPG